MTLKTIFPVVNFLLVEFSDFADFFLTLTGKKK